MKESPSVVALLIPLVVIVAICGLVGGMLNHRPDHGPVMTRGYWLFAGVLFGLCVITVVVAAIAELF